MTRPDGNTKIIETMPPIMVTPIVYGDEMPEQTFAETQVLSDSAKQIELEDEVFICAAKSLCQLMNRSIATCPNSLMAAR